MDGPDPANGVYDMTFALFDLDVDGTSAGVYTNENVEVIDGLYVVQLPFTPSELDFTNRWIEIAAKANGDLGDRTVLSPRSMLDTVPYASKASQADGVSPAGISTESLQFGAVTADKLGSGSVTLEKINTVGAADGQTMVLRGSEMAWESLAYWSLLGNYGTIPGINFIGTLDDQTLEFRVNNQTALRLIPNEYAPNIVVGGLNNVMAADRIGSVISGGFENTVNGNVGTVAGGQGNTAGGIGTGVGGGLGNTAAGSSSYVGGGNSNTAEGPRSVVAGGSGNVALGVSSVVVGGTANTATAGGAFVGGGENNEAFAAYSAVVGGENNRATNRNTFVGGGSWNTAGIDYAVIGGGVSNLNQSTSGFIGAGTGNHAGGSRAAIGAGMSNETFGSDSFIGSGTGNFSRGKGSFIGAGFSNEALGDYSSVLGGIFNRAVGFGSVAAGLSAEALHNGTFVYSDGTSEFSSTAEDQFLIQAGGGVGIGTNEPETALDVAGKIRASEGVQFGDGSVQTKAAFDGWNVTNNTFQVDEALPLRFEIQDQLTMRIEPNEYAPNIVVGGLNNVMAADRIGSVISGGFENTVNGNVGTVAGGQGNTAGGIGTGVGGGLGNTAAGSSSYVGGGNSNTAEGPRSVVAGGSGNVALGVSSVVVGGTANTATAGGAFVGGGENNEAFAAYSAVVGGENNRATNRNTFVGGGSWNTAGIDYAVIGGGVSNLNQSTSGFIGAGTGNHAGGSRAAIGAGMSNETFGSDSFIGSGTGNFSRGKGSFIGAGFSNEALGDYSSVLGGIFNRAVGFGSVAAGLSAEALHNGTFVYSDGTSEFSSTAEDQFLIQAGGGVGIGTNEPETALDVAGKIRASEGVQFGDGSVQTKAAFDGWNVTNNTFQVDEALPLRFEIQDQLTMRIEPNEYAPNIVVGGLNNVMAADRIGSVISGGFENTVNGNVGTVAGGQGNTAGGIGTGVGGGLGNTAAGSSSYVGGGNSNTAEGPRSVVAGGSGNVALGVSSVVVGGTANTATAGGAFVGGGENNEAFAAYSAVVGGENNRATNRNTFVGGGSWNTAGIDYAVIGGGVSNLNQSTSGFIGAGTGNHAGGSRAAIGAGMSNETFGSDSFIGSGTGNFSRGKGSFIGAGFSNEALGDYSSVLGGIFNRAVGFGSVAAGLSAEALHNGTFVYSDGTSEFSSTAEDQFLIQAGGGVGIGTNEPETALDVAGGIKANTVQLTEGAAAGYSLTSDAEGNATWQRPAVYSQESSGFSSSVGGSNNSVQADVSGAAISGGSGNRVSKDFAVVAGGENNRGYGAYSTAGGGRDNRVTGDAGTISGGRQNRVSEFAGTVSGGQQNDADGYASSVSGGLSNEANGQFSLVAGGIANLANGNRSSVGGGGANRADGHSTSVAGGNRNSASSDYAVVAGGDNNLADAEHAAVGGGFFNTAAGPFSTIPGGLSNFALGQSSFAAGQFATAGHDGSFVWSDASGGRVSSTDMNQFLIAASGGVGIGTNAPAAALHVNGTTKVNALQIGDSATAGYVLTADADGRGTWQSPSADGGRWALNGNSGVSPSNYLGTTDEMPLKLGVNGSPVWQLIPTPVSPNILAGHPGNSVGNSAVGVIVAGGGGETGNNDATADFATVGGGAGNSVSGMFGTVPGGYGNTAAGEGSFAAGNRAQAIHPGSMLLSDGRDQDFVSAAINEFAVRATGGVRFMSGLFGGSFVSGVRLAPGSGSWSQLSDRNSKENLAPVNPREVLDRVASLSMTTWNYRSQDASVRHLGPMAQDFAAAFGVGENNTSISSVDADGVALAAIQGLNEVVLEKDAEIQSLKERLADLEGMVQQLIERADSGSSLR